MIDYATEIANGATNEDLNAKYGTSFNYEAAIQAGKTSADIDGYLSTKKTTPIETPVTETPATETPATETPEIIDYATELNNGKTNDDLNTIYGTKFNYEAAIKAGKTTEQINEYLKIKKNKLIPVPTDSVQPTDKREPNTVNTMMENAAAVKESLKTKGTDLQNKITNAVKSYLPEDFIQGGQQQLKAQAQEEVVKSQQPYLGKEARVKLNGKDYFDYLDAQDDETKAKMQQEDLEHNIEAVVAKKIATSPLAIGKGLTDTMGKHQMLGVGRLLSPFLPEETNEFVNKEIIDIGSKQKFGSDNYGTWYDVGKFISQNAASIASLGLAPYTIAGTMFLEAGVQAFDIPARTEEDGKPIGVTKGLKEGAMNVGIASGVMALSKVLPYALRGFKSKDLHATLNPTTELGKENYEQLANAIEYANKNNIRLSELMTNEAGTLVDTGYAVSKGNYFNLRDIFKGSDDFSARSLDMFQDMINLGKKDAEIQFGAKTLEERRQLMTQFQASVKTYRKKWQDIESKAWGPSIDDAMPKFETNLGNFYGDLKADLTKRGFDPAVANTIETMTQGRFKKGYAGIKKEHDMLIDSLAEAKRSKEAFNKTFNGNAQEYMEGAKLADDKIADIKSRILQIKDTVRATPEDLLNTIKLINKKMYVPGGNISIKDKETLAGLRVAKERMEEQLQTMLKDYPEATKALEEARELTRTRLKAFGNPSQSDDSLVLVNALLDKDTPKVLTALQDPDKGLEHMHHIKEWLGKDSEGFKQAMGLYLRAKIDIPGGVYQLKRTDKAAGGLRGDFGKLSQALSNVTRKDIQFIKENIGQEIGKDLDGYISLVNNYSEIHKAAETLASGKGQKPALQYIGENVKELPGIIMDAVMYNSAKASRALLGSPKTKSAIGGTYQAVMSDEEFGSDEYYYDILKGMGIGYATGYAGRHLFERRIDAINRIVMNRKSNGEALKSINKEIDKIKKIGAQFDDFLQRGGHPIESAGGGKPTEMSMPGKPEKYYHGTGEDFTQFKDDQPVFLTSDKDGANWYAQERGDNPKVLDVDVTSSKPLEINSTEGYNKFKDLIRESGVQVDDDGFIAEVSKHSPYDGSNIYDALYIPRVREYLKSKGYDAVKFNDVVGNREIPTMVPLDTKQAKLIK